MTTTLAPTETRARPRVVPGLAAAVVAMTFLQIKAGALVTSTGSGMAFPDWPTSNGSLWPQSMALDEKLEFGHRVWGALLGLATLVLTVLVHRFDPRRWVRRLMLGNLGLICIQGVLGGVSVRWNNPSWLSAPHGILGQLCLCSLMFAAFALSPGWEPRVIAPAAQVQRARRLALWGVVAICTQLALGAIARHEQPLWAVTLHVALALVVALVVMIGALYAGSRFAAVRGFTGVKQWTLGILLSQLVLGFVTLMVRRPKDPSNIEYFGRAVVVTLHVVVGASLFLLASLLLFKTWRNLALSGERA